METDSFLTIEKPSEGIFKEKGSRFLAFAFPVCNEEEIRVILSDIRHQYHDARHHCYAWRLGVEMSHFRANDDGEPGNSAGKPILGQIQAFEVSNILIVVVRYFGGTLLGVGGLIQAYKTAAMEALNNATIIRQFVFNTYIVLFKYENMNLVMKVLKDLGLEQWDQQFELSCSLKTRIRKSQTKELLEAFPFDNSVELQLITIE